ncbi:PD40 domain-containing protein [Frigoribacterium sp. CFBP 13729]|uniref:TolB family protein n=1 Tax=Frigoribacterium sp. CFBP 13729 TaxID=2775293 RepID=UPI001787741C|nr:PD40 domain-containing protein [Frigoribacterium sp. CFBP 13729]MBD8609832.1 PD40 domain-containing protein [Frigoribacterium sp. CFBP 13729]
MPRTLQPGQSSRVLVVDPATGDVEVALESSSVLVEAPNWSPDGRWLVVNADGLLWRLPAEARGVDETALVPVPMGDVPEINNDHVIAPDQGSVFVSSRDGHLYEVPWDGVAPGGEARRVTREHPAGRNHKNYLHGVSPDGATLSVIVGALPEAVADPDDEEARAGWQTNVVLVSVADGAPTSVTADGHPDDGAEFSPDGRHAWFNSERASGGVAGHAQLFRARPDGGELVQVTDDELVNWFPHVSPDGSTLLWLGYPAGTLGHPEDHDVVLRTLPLGTDGLPTPGEQPRDVLRLLGGQGTINVPCWAPDSTRFACVDYPRG